MFALALYRKPQESHFVTIPKSIKDLLFHFAVLQNLLYPAENIKCLKSHLGPCNFKHKTCQDAMLTHVKKFQRIKFTAALRETDVNLWFRVLLLFKVNLLYFFLYVLPPNYPVVWSQNINARLGCCFKLAELSATATAKGSPSSAQVPIGEFLPRSTGARCVLWLFYFSSCYV